MVRQRKEKFIDTRNIFVVVRVQQCAAFDINRSSLCAHCSVAIRRRKFLVYFLLRLPAHFQPGQLQPKQHGDVWSDPHPNRQGYDSENYSFDEKMLATRGNKLFLFRPAATLMISLRSLFIETRKY